MATTNRIIQAPGGSADVEARRLLPYATDDVSDVGGVNLTDNLAPVARTAGVGASAGLVAGSKVAGAANLPG